MKSVNNHFQDSRITNGMEDYCGVAANGESVDMEAGMMHQMPKMMQMKPLSMQQMAVKQTAMQHQAIQKSAMQQPAMKQTSIQQQAAKQQSAM